MDKKRLKMFISFVLMIALIQSGCEKNLYDEHLQHKRIKTDINLSQFKRETGLNKISKHIKIKTNFNTNLERNSDGSYEVTDFIIDFDIIKRIEFNEKITYTLQIKPIEEVSDRFFNIIYYFKDGWQTNIVEIKPKQENLIQILNGTTEMIDGTLKTIFNSSTSSQDCISYVYWYETCPQEAPCTPSWCDGCITCVHRVTTIECYPDPTILFLDAGSSSGGNTSSGLGANPSSNDNEIATTPVINSAFLDAPKNPCSELMKLNTNNSIQQTLRILKGESSGQNEHGNYISETTNSLGATYLSFPIIPQNPNKPYELDIPAGLSTGKVKGVMHCHTDPASTLMFPMFSAADFAILYNIAYSHIPSNNATKDYSEYTVMLSVGSGHYALKFKNFNGDYNSNLNSNFNAFKTNLENDNMKIGHMANSNLLIQNFLNNLNKFFGNEVGLFKATESTDSNGLALVTGWKELTLDSTGTIIEIFCP